MWFAHDIPVLISMGTKRAIVTTKVSDLSYTAGVVYYVLVFVRGGDNRGEETL